MRTRSNLIVALFAIILLTGCSTTPQKAVYVPIPLFEGKTTSQIDKVEAKLLAANPFIPIVSIHSFNHPGNNAFILRYYDEHGPIHMFIQQGFLSGHSDTVIANLLGHEYGHAVSKNKHLDTYHGKHTPAWKQREADDIGMIIAANAGYDPCQMWKIAPYEIRRKARIKRRCGDIDALKQEYAEDIAR